MSGSGERCTCGHILVSGKKKGTYWHRASGGASDPVLTCSCGCTVPRPADGQRRDDPYPMVATSSGDITSAEGVLSKWQSASDHLKAITADIESLIDDLQLDTEDAAVMGVRKPILQYSEARTLREARKVLIVTSFDLQRACEALAVVIQGNKGMIKQEA